MSFVFAENISPYLIDTQDIVVTARKQPICNVPEMNKGSQPTDGGFLLLNETEKEEIIKKSPIAQKWIRPFLGSKEFLNGRKKWCLWLVDASPNELRKCKSVIKRIKNVKQFRFNSKRIETQKSAIIPSLFAEIRQPSSSYLVIPRTTSENRKYIPMDFINKHVIVGDTNQIIPNATLYHFGILTSSIHMAWMRAVCGRLEMIYIFEFDSLQQLCLAGLYKKPKRSHRKGGAGRAGCTQAISRQHLS